ncbi:MAG: selenide, water dikinase SelD [Bacteroidetes bacterium]|nr:MAG: selenide, water dikinase SelD [Bacteroidota bacterium]
MEVKLTSLTKGGGCGCKLPPSSLEDILQGQKMTNEFGLVVGNSSGDDCAAWDLRNGEYLLSTLDFFTPIVDDPFDFGRIAAANSISDVYSMGGRPVVATAILGWPVDKLEPTIASKIIEGARAICDEAGIAIGGGHSIENPEPIFGLSVNGIVESNRLKKNQGMKEGDLIVITKKVGTGMLSTALKREGLSSDIYQSFLSSITELNKIGRDLSSFDQVHAMTDITGFGILGHLLEMVADSKLTVELNYENVPLLDGAKELAGRFVYADNTMRNWKSYGEKVEGISGESMLTLCDPQTNGGIMFAVDEERFVEVQEMLSQKGQFYAVIGKVVPQSNKEIVIK